MNKGWPLAPVGGPTCVVCDGDSCKGFHDIEVHEKYPFMKGEAKLASKEETVVAPHRIVDEELGRVVYGPGDEVPMSDAIKYGLVSKPKKRAAKPKQNRAKKLREDRSK